MTFRRKHVSVRRSLWLAAIPFGVLVAAAGLATPPLAASAAGPALSQCDGGDGAGSVIVCTITVVNTLGGGATGSTVTVARHCAGVNVPCGETPGTTTTSAQLVTDITQCNNAGNGGGSTMTCQVTVTNEITGNATAVAATSNECNGSGDGLGAPTVICDPFPATTSGASVTQCNGSANGGTLVGLDCGVASAATWSSALPVTVNQCNNSENGGGSKLNCTVSITNTIVAAATAAATTAAGTTTAGTTAGATTVTSTPTSTPTVTAGGRPPVPETGGTQLTTIIGGTLVVLATMLLVGAVRRRRDS